MLTGAIFYLQKLFPVKNPVKITAIALFLTILPPLNTFVTYGELNTLKNEHYIVTYIVSYYLLNRN